jgi:dihydroorotase
MNALGGFADAVFTPYQQSGARRDAIIEHIYDASAFGIVGEYSKIVCRRIAIYHLYLANRK